MQADASPTGEPLPRLDFPLPGVIFGHGLRLLQNPECERYALFVQGTALWQWQVGDDASQRLVMGQVVGAKLASHIAVAEVFGVHRNTVARIARQVETEGVEATVRRKPGPRHAHKVTPVVRAELRRAVEEGRSTYGAQRELLGLGVALTQSHVDRLMRQIRAEQAEQPAPLWTDPDGGVMETPEEPAAIGEMEVGRVEDEAIALAERPALGTGLEPGASVRSRYLGLTLFFPALQGVGMLTIAEQVYRLTGPVRFGVRQVIWPLVCLELLQEPTIERVKHLLRADMGAVIGCGRAACVKTLRRKLADLSGQRQAVKLGLLLARHWLEVGLLNASYLYVDGHMKVYSGKRLAQEVWNSQRRMPLPGIEQYFVNDLRGRPLLVVSQDISGNLAKSMPQVVAAIRQVLGERRFTVIFDRGGYDGKLFAWLGKEKIDFITYQRGTVALPANQFRRREVRWEGKRVRFWIAEDRVVVGDSGPWRRIVLRTADGHQTPILTSLTAEAVAGARVTALMLARWRQENFFKYARSHLGLDVLTSYATDPVPDRQVPNPEVKATRRELQQLRATAQKVRAALGRTVVLEAQQASPPEDGTPGTTVA